MNIFPDFRAQVNRLPAVEFLLERKGIDVEILLKLFQAGDTFEAEPQMKAPGREDAPVGESDIERAVQWGGRRGPRRLQFKKSRINLIFNVKRSILWNLAEVNFHESGAYLARSCRAT